MTTDKESVSFRCPVHDFVRVDLQQRYDFDQIGENHILALIETLPFQRLRRISHLGISHLSTYIGATSNRFAHSLGTYWLMKKLLRKLLLAEPLKSELGEELKALAWHLGLAGALLHDIGHLPFSHLGEKLFTEDEESEHESYTARLLGDGEIRQILDSVGSKLGRTDFSKSVAELVSFRTLREEAQLSFLSRLLTGHFNADRLDYLLRDAHYSGVKCGKFDAEWLVENIACEPDRHRIVFPVKALPALEEYFLARFYQYQAIAFHHTTRGLEHVLINLWQRIRRLKLRDSKVYFNLLERFPQMASAIDIKKGLDLSEWPLFDDGFVIEVVKFIHAESTDEIARNLATMFLRRQPLKVIAEYGMLSDNSVTGEKPFFAGQRYRALRDEVVSKTANDEERDAYTAEDTARLDVYDPNEEKGDHVLVKCKTGLVEVHRVSSILKHLASEEKKEDDHGEEDHLYNMFRYYATDDIRQAVQV